MLTDKGWITARAVLTGYWPALRATLDDGRTGEFWRRELANGSDEDVLTGIKGYAKEAPEFPTLPAILQWVRSATKARVANIPYLPAPGSMTVDEWERARIMEAKEFRRTYPELMTDEQLGARVAAIRTEGPFEKRVKGLQDGSDTRTVGEWWSATFGHAKARTDGPERLGDLL